MTSTTFWKMLEKMLSMMIRIKVEFEKTLLDKKFVL